MSKDSEDPPKPEASELPSEVPAQPEGEAGEKPLELQAVNSLGLLSDPEAFEVAWSEAQKAVMLIFPQESGSLFLGFQGPAGEKFLTSMLVLLNLLIGTGMVKREGNQTFEVPEKKTPTLH